MREERGPGPDSLLSLIAGSKEVLRPGTTHQLLCSRVYVAHVGKFHVGGLAFSCPQREPRFTHVGLAFVTSEQ